MWATRVVLVASLAVTTAQYEADLVAAGTAPPSVESPNTSLTSGTDNAGPTVPPNEDDQGLSTRSILLVLGAGVGVGLVLVARGKRLRL
jgi:hypothetical protein